MCEQVIADHLQQVGLADRDGTPLRVLDDATLRHAPPTAYASLAEVPPLTEPDEP